jgi:hypothetical protein
MMSAWSPGGRYVVFARQKPDSYSEVDGLLIVDARTFAMRQLDLGGPPLGGYPMFAPGGKHLVVKGSDAITVFDLETGATTMPTRGAVYTQPEFLDDGRLMWAAQERGQDIVYVRDLATGTEVSLAAPSRRATDEDAHPTIDDMVFDHRGRLVTRAGGSDSSGTGATIRVWDVASQKLLMTLEGVADPKPQLDDTGKLIYAVADGADHLRVAIAAPDHPDRAPVELRAPGGCDRAVVLRSIPIVPCGPHLFGMRTQTHACLWDSDRGTLVKSQAVSADVTGFSCQHGQLDAYMEAEAAEESTAAAEREHGPYDGKARV